MNCPYCFTQLQSIDVNINNQQEKVLECLNCGGHWFPRFLANNITSNDATTIDAVIPKSTPTPPQEPRCPYCQNRLVIIGHDPVPKGIKVLACPQGHGNFFPYLQLLQFKKAQEAKITYHTLWGIPIKSIVSVMLPVIAVIAITAGVPLTLEQLNKQQETRTSASVPYTTPIATPRSDNSVIIIFSTTDPHTSIITIFEDNVPLKDYPVSLTPSTTHRVTIEDLTPNAPYTYTLTLTNPTTNEIIKSPHFPLTIITK